MFFADKDPMGKAIHDYQFLNKKEATIQVLSSITFPDIFPVQYLFRSYNNMPDLEKKALSLCKGKILDVGAGAGCHSIYLQKQNKNVTSLDISALSCKVMKAHGLKNVLQGDILNFTHAPFDTILMLMNGIGICGNITTLNSFFKTIKKLLAPGGKILLDSSDIRYMFEDDEGILEFDLNAGYYGEVQYKMQYDDIVGEEFDWLFVDFETLNFYAESNGLTCKKIMSGPHFDFLAEIC